ncbi:MAG: asparagine synthase (glutamine-hydrolyzing) [Candidatus Omnitrophica bacterium]|nr:asparagine synthase (glutamine-hydrolyzing) [Candidatus Omnitrophota bacterium]
MCGICGVVLDEEWAAVDAAPLRRMNEALVHRGPDDEGMWCGGPAGLAMRRLSIIDVAGGHQPISNEDRTVWVVFNGEIYNFQELRTTLAAQGHRFSTQTDTEVLVHLYEQEGMGFVKRLRGMFAFALWDVARRKLVLARDRLGIKPLYYTHQHGHFVFASELKALLQHPVVERRLSLEGVDSYVTYGYIPAPRTPFAEIHKLPPATILTVQAGRVSQERYWGLSYTEKLTVTFEEAAQGFVERLREAVQQHLISDVPLGAFLSGGMDSSVMVALMSEVSRRPVKTFSIGYEGGGDELRYARMVAKRFGTDHHEFVARPNLAEMLPELVWWQDEPFFDNSMLPTYAVARFARPHVTVALSGDGGDELLGGYEWTRRYQMVRMLNRVPVALREGLRSALLGKAFVPGYESDRLSRVKRLLYDSTCSLEEGFARRTTASAAFRAQLYTEELKQRLAGYEARQIQTAVFAEAQVSDAREAMLYVDTMLFLPDDCLFKVDRMSMANALEVRVPFLDHEVVEYASQLPFAYKVAGLTTKRLLKHAMRGTLPPAVLRQRKQGFTLPIARWLRGELGTSAAASGRWRSLSCGRGSISTRFVRRNRRSACAR